MATLIIGATGGIGSALARLWPQERGPLTLSGRDPQRLETLATALGAAAHPADLGYESHVRALFADLQTPLDTIIYAAGAAHPQPLGAVDAGTVRRVWNANYFGALWTLTCGLPLLAAGGRMYFLGARPEFTQARGFGQYAASKAALARLLDIARLEGGRSGPTMTLVLPPAVDTPLWQQVGKLPRGALSADAVARAIVQDRAGAGVTELRVD